MAKPLTRRRLPRLLRIGLWSLAGLTALVVVGGTIVALTFDPDSLKPRVVAAVKQATGRDLTLQGRIRLGLSLQPTLVVQDVSFANPPGFSRPQMATLRELNLTLALIPLLSNRIEIDRLVLVGPDILLETDAQGRPNWQFTPEAAQPAVQPAAATPPAADGASARLSVAEIRVQDGKLGWRDGRTGRAASADLTSLRATAASPDANLRFVAAAAYNSVPISLQGEFGPLARLQAPQSAIPGPATPWPVRLELEAAGAKLALDGTLDQPTQGRGYAMKVTANVPAVASLAALAPGQTLPDLRDVSLAAQVADSGGPVPHVSSLVLHVGASDLTAIVAGLKLDKLDISAARLDQPAQLAAEGSINGTQAVLTGSTGAPAALLPGAKAEAIPLDLNLRALGSTLVVKGTATRGTGGRTAVKADVTADTIDLDALGGAFGRKPPPATPAAGPAQTGPAQPRAAPGGRMIPDTPIPFHLLRQADADVKLSIGQLKSRGAVYRTIAARIDLRDGKLRLDPVSADLPEGHVEAALTADATQANPAVTMRLRIPALALQPTLAALGQPAVLAGNVNVQADLRGAGATPHAIAAGLEGSLSATMTNGTLDNRLLGSMLGSILRDAAMLDLVGRGGGSEVKCLVARVEANRGVATVRSLVFASSLITMDGDGSINLGAETLDLRLRPQGRVGGTGFVIPLRVSGPWRAPNAASDPAATVAQNAGTVAGAVLGTTSPLGIVAGALAGRQVLTGAEGVDCGTGGAGGPATQAPRPAQQQQQPKLPDIGGALKQLLR